MDKNILNLEEIDKQSQHAWLVEKHKMTVEKIKKIQEGIELE